MGLGLNPSPPGQRVLYSATKQKCENIGFCIVTSFVLYCVIYYSKDCRCVVRTGVGCGAEFTGVSPSFPVGAAAGSSSYAHANLCAAGDSSIATGKDVQEAVTNTSI